MFRTGVVILFIIMETRNGECPYIHNLCDKKECDEYKEYRYEKCKGYNKITHKIKSFCRCNHLTLVQRLEEFE